MKIINVAILFVLAIFPMFMIQHQEIRWQHEAQYLEHMYDLYLDTAVKDAVAVLGTSRLKDGDRHISDIRFDLNLDEAIRAFTKSLTQNFGADGNEYTQKHVLSYVPAVAVIDYDGFYIWALDEYTDSSGARRLEHVWRAKMPYAYSDSSGNSISFTLDDYVHVFVQSTGQWFEGTFDELRGKTSVAVLNDRYSFERMKRQTIINLLQDSLEYHINRHTQLVYNIGVKYTFVLPYIDDDTWANTISDVGMLAFLQGIPVGTREYNNFALGGAKLFRKSPVIGTIRNSDDSDDSDGEKYYFDSRCDIPVEYERVEVFQSKFDAAKAGYMPVDCLNPGVM